MNDLLTAKDVEIKVFKKVKFGGYSVPEVEDFLNQVADDLEAYALQIEEKDDRIQEFEALIKKQESMKDSIKDTLILARQTAQDVESQAQTKAEKIIEDAKTEAEKIIAEAKNSAEEILKNSQDKRAQAEQSKANIEIELEAQKREAHDKAEEILADARVEARKLVSDAQNDIGEYEKQLRYLSLQKQQFVKNTVSLLLEFGKIIDKAQQEIDDEAGLIGAEPEQKQETNE